MGECEGQDPGQGGHSARAAASDLCGQTARGRPHAVGLQYPERVDSAPRAAPAWRKLKRFRFANLQIPMLMMLDPLSFLTISDCLLRILRIWSHRFLLLIV